MNIFDIFLILLGLILSFILTKSYKMPRAGFIFVLFYSIYVYLSMFLFQAEESVTYEAVFLVRLGYLAIILALTTVSLAIPYNKRFCLQESNNKIVPLAHLYTLYFIGFLSVTMCLFYLIMIPEIPLLQMLYGSYDVVFREQATTTFKMFGFFSVFFNYLLPLVWSGYLLISKFRRAFCLFFFNIVIVAATGQKAPIMYLTIVMIMIFSYIRGRFNYFLVILLITPILIIVSGLIIYTQYFGTHFDSDSLNLAIDALKSRALLTSGEMINEWTEVFPNVLPFQVFDSTTIPLDQFVCSYYSSGSNIIGSHNAAFIAEIYARFGFSFILVFFVIFLVSVFIFTIDSFFTRAHSKFIVSSYGLYTLIGVRLCITDYLTAIRPILLVVLSFFGICFLIEILIINPLKKKDNIFLISTTRSKLIVIISIFTLIYYIQGMLKGLFL